MSILDEIDKEQGSRTIIKCATCRFLVGRDDREEWEAALQPNSGRTTRAIHVVMVKHGFRHTDASVSYHRRGHK